MTKRLRIALALVLAAVLGGVAWRVLRQPEPVYQGKPLSFWLKGFLLDNQLGKTSLNQAAEAVLQTGTNSFPVLLQFLRARDSGWKRAVISVARKLHLTKLDYVSADSYQWAAREGFFVLGKNAQYAVPALVEIYDERISRPELKSHCQGYIAEILWFLKDEDMDVSEEVAKAFKRILANGTVNEAVK